MTSIRCYLGRTRPDLLGTSPFTTHAALNGLTIEQHFRAGSLTGGGGPAIDFTLDATRLDRPVLQGEDTSAFELNQALARLRGTSGPDTDGITIGLILANRYRGQNKVFGVMFDRDADALGGGQSFATVQRQGCGVFLEAIRAEHGDQSEAFREHSLFTAIHELAGVYCGLDGIILK
jgi:hypothetical protein